MKDHMKLHSRDEEVTTSLSHAVKQIPRDNFIQSKSQSVIPLKKYATEKTCR